MARGQMRALGRVDDLRARDGVMLEIAGPSTRTRWADGIAGVVQADYDTEADLTTLRLDPAVADDQAILT
ncbi:ABC transporter ATP-binding protein, partial [Streptomyces sp. SID10244]|nr:ABC transporter ATP-binding protein [Streptomyces sp. SID10244]